MIDAIRIRAHILAFLLLAWLGYRALSYPVTVGPPGETIPLVTKAHLPQREPGQVVEKVTDCFRIPIPRFRSTRQSSSAGSGTNPGNELDETIVLTLDPLEGATLGEHKVHTITVVDNDVPPVLSFSERGQTADESSGAVVAEVFVDSPSDVDISGSYSLSGSAAEGADYGGFAGRFTIPAGSTSAQLTGVLNDDADEFVEDGWSLKSQRNTTQEFSLILQAVLEVPGLHQARISGRTVQVGGALAGFDSQAPPVLTSVEAGVVSVSYRGNLYTLDMHERSTVICSWDPTAEITTPDKNLNSAPDGATPEPSSPESQREGAGL